jgi:hypothetical protein
MSEEKNRNESLDDRSGAEIKVTPEMIKAGVSVFCAFDCRFESEDEIVKRIYLAMATTMANSGEMGL